MAAQPPIVGRTYRWTSERWKHLPSFTVTRVCDEGVYYIYADGTDGAWSLNKWGVDEDTVEIDPGSRGTELQREHGAYGRWQASRYADDTDRAAAFDLGCDCHYLEGDTHHGIGCPAYPKPIDTSKLEFRNPPDFVWPPGWALVDALIDGPAGSAVDRLRDEMRKSGPNSVTVMDLDTGDVVSRSTPASRAAADFTDPNPSYFHHVDVAIAAGQAREEEAKRLPVADYAPVGIAADSQAAGEAEIDRLRAALVEIKRTNRDDSLIDAVVDAALAGKPLP